MGASAKASAPAGAPTERPQRPNPGGPASSSSCGSASETLWKKGAPRGCSTLSASRVLNCQAGRVRSNAARSTVPRTGRKSSSSWLNGRLRTWASRAALPVGWSNEERRERSPPLQRLPMEGALRRRLWSSDDWSTACRTANTYDHRTTIVGRPEDDACTSLLYPSGKTWIHKRNSSRNTYYCAFSSSQVLLSLLAHTTVALRESNAGGLLPAALPRWLLSRNCIPMSRRGLSTRPPGRCVLHRLARAPCSSALLERESEGEPPRDSAVALTPGGLPGAPRPLPPGGRLLFGGVPQQSGHNHGARVALRSPATPRSPPRSWTTLKAGASRRTRSSRFPTRTRPPNCSSFPIGRGAGTTCSPAPPTSSASGTSAPRG